jgi:subtilisin family serine protease
MKNRNTKYFCWVVVSVSAFLWAPTQAQTKQGWCKDRVANEFIVSTVGTGSNAPRSNKLTQESTTIKTLNAYLEALDVPVNQVSIIGKSGFGIVKTKNENFLSLNSTQQVLEPNCIFKTIQNKVSTIATNTFSLPPVTITPPSAVYPDDEGVPYQWGIYNFDFPGIDAGVLRAWELLASNTNQKSVIAVLDSGVDLEHPELSNQLFNFNDIPNNGIDEDQNGYIDDTWGLNSSEIDPVGAVGDANGHGSHVAGVALASSDGTYGVIGINPGAKLLTLKGSSDTEGFFTTGSILRSLEYLRVQNMRGVKVRVVNLSLGGEGECSIAFSEMFQRLNERGIVVVVSAGNSDTNIDEESYTPAGCSGSNILSVGALDRSGGITSFSNYGVKNVDLVAPGTNILSTYIPQGWSYLTGTSMAAPFVTGAVSLMFEANPFLTADQAVNIVKESVIKDDRLSAYVASGGMLNIGRAVEMALQAEVVATTPSPMSTLSPTPTSRPTLIVPTPFYTSTPNPMPVATESPVVDAPPTTIPTVVATKVGTSYNTPPKIIRSKVIGIRRANVLTIRAKDIKAIDPDSRVVKAYLSLSINGKRSKIAFRRWFSRGVWSFTGRKVFVFKLKRRKNQKRSKIYYGLLRITDKSWITSKKITVRVR